MFSSGRTAGILRRSRSDDTALPSFSAGDSRFPSCCFQCRFGPGCPGSSRRAELGALEMAKTCCVEYSKASRL